MLQHFTYLKALDCHVRSPEIEIQCLAIHFPMSSLLHFSPQTLIESEYFLLSLLYSWSVTPTAACSLALLSCDLAFCDEIAVPERGAPLKSVSWLVCQSLDLRAIASETTTTTKSTKADAQTAASGHCLQGLVFCWVLTTNEHSWVWVEMDRSRTSMTVGYR